MSDKLRSTGGIFTVREGKLIGMVEQPYLSESILQRLVADYPGLLAGDQVGDEEPRRWLLVTREMAVPGEEEAGGRWSLDHLFLDQDGVPTLIEVKRSTDTRIRREVVGQMLDYAANGVAYWPVEMVRSRFEGRCRNEGKEPESELAALLGGDFGIEDFWLRVKTNLQAGKIRLIFIADEIPRELRRIVEFLNEQMDPAEVLALEVKEYGAEQQKVLLARLVGQTAEAERKKRTGGSPSPLVFGSFLKNVADKVNECLARQGSGRVLWRKTRTKDWEQTCSRADRNYVAFLRIEQSPDLGRISLIYCLEHLAQTDPFRAFDRYEEQLRRELSELPCKPVLEPPDKRWRKLRYEVDGVDPSTLGRESTIDEAARCLVMFVKAHRLLVGKLSEDGIESNAD